MTLTTYGTTVHVLYQPTTSPACYEHSYSDSPARYLLEESTPLAQSLTNIFDTADRPSLTIAKLTPKGFHLSDDLVVPGGLVLAGYQALLWDVDPPKGDGSAGIDAAWAGWTKERFQVFESVVPRPGT
jgi:NADH dehydrogenase [ubiquinone] 1 alpha subcomplex assembly factor 3